MKTQLRTWTVMSTLAAGAWSAAQTTAPPAPPSPPSPQAVPAAPAAPAHVRTMRGRGSQTPYLGVNIEEITADRASALKLKEPRGAEVTVVDADAAAGKAGIKVHDVITSYNGQPVEGSEQLRRLIRETPVGRTVQIGIVRNGSPMNLQATIGSHDSMGENFYSMGHMPPMPPMAPVVVDIPDIDITTVEAGRTYAPSTGIVAESLTPQLAEYFGSKNGQGVLIRSVEKGSPAEKAGLRAGDIILRVGDDTIETRSDFRRALRLKSGSVKVVVLREKRETTLTLALPERHSAVRDEGFVIDMGDFEAKLGELEPQILHAQLQAKEEFSKQQDKIREQMEKAREELDRAMERLREEQIDRKN